MLKALLQFGFQHLPEIRGAFDKFKNQPRSLVRPRSINFRQHFSKSISQDSPFKGLLSCFKSQKPVSAFRAKKGTQVLSWLTLPKSQVHNYSNSKLLKKLGIFRRYWVQRFYIQPLTNILLFITKFCVYFFISIRYSHDTYTVKTLNMRRVFYVSIKGMGHKSAHAKLHILSRLNPGWSHRSCQSTK